MGEKCTVLMKIASGEKTSSYMVEKKGEYFKLNVPNMIEVIEGKEIELKELKLEELNKAWIDRYNKWGKKRERLLEHLVQYKKNVLKIEKPGFWKGEEYGHILPEGEEEKNLIDKGFFKALQRQKEKILLHPSFGHLNSSQAMCLNFVVPLLKKDKLLSCIQTVCPGVVEGTSLIESESEFEKVVETKEKTQFDFYCTTDKGETLSFEFKYSEQNFYSMKDDERHQEKYDEIYKDKIQKLGVDKEDFAADYQLWRNILYAKTHQYTVFFVFPKFRKDLQEVVESAKNKCPEEIKKRIHCIFIDDCVTEILEDDDSSLKEHYTEFKDKYLPQL